MQTENEQPRCRWPAEFSGAATSRNKNFNSCNKENVFSKERLFQKAMSPQNQRNRAFAPENERSAPNERLMELVRRRDRLLREKLNYSSLFSELRKEKERLEAVNQRMVEEEEFYRKRIHEMEKEQLAQYRRNEREKEELLDKIQMLSQMEVESGASRIGQVEEELRKVKELFFEQEKVNSERYNSLLKESEELQQQNRRLKDYLESKKRPAPTK